MKPFVPQALPLEGIDWGRLVPLLGKANRALAQYSGALHALPNPEVLLSPFTTQEAVLSSQIEGTVATLEQVLKFEAGEQPEQESKRADIQEIINYRRALRRAQEELKSRPFNLNLLLKLHSILLNSVRGRSAGRGAFRTQQNWIGAPGSTIDQAEFVPPEPIYLAQHLDNWEKYYHADRPDPLAQLAIVHAQFEIIHPFGDGNGRLGRILIPLFLFEKDILPSPTFYLSAYLEANRDTYIGRLRAIGREEDAWNRWIEFFLAAITEQSRTNIRKAQALLKLYEDLKRRIIELTRSSYAIPLLDQLFSRPLFAASTIKFDGRAPSRQMVAQLLRVLRDAGILKVVREGRGRRAQILALREVINLCEGGEIV